MRLRNSLGSLARDTRGVSLIEMALILPILIMVGLGFSELVHLAMTNTRVNQIALSVADNASRAKQASVSGPPRMREFDIGEIFRGAELQFPGVNISGKGRIVLSSLEPNADGGQWIHWQRCFGSLTTSASKYGVQGTGITGTALAGMGPSDRIVTADADSAVMFAEVYLDYEPLFFDFLIGNKRIYKAAAMYVRDDRDLTQLYNPSPISTVRTC